MWIAITAVAKWELEERRVSCIATIPTCASMILGVIGVLGWKAHHSHAYFQTVFWEVRYEWQNVD